jgi:outer membrane protein assembly factor BamE
MIALMQVTTMGRRPPLRIVRRALGLSLGLLALSLTQGCIYRLPIQQGNHIEQSVVAQVKPGMTHAQVRYLLGTPIVPGAFDNERWDYDYYLKLRRLNKPLVTHVTVYFKNDLVDHVVSDAMGDPAEPIGPPPVTSTGA